MGLVGQLDSHDGGVVLVRHTSDCVLARQDRRDIALECLRGMHACMLVSICLTTSPLPPGRVLLHVRMVMKQVWKPVERMYTLIRRCASPLVPETMPGRRALGAMKAFVSGALIASCFSSQLG